MNFKILTLFPEIFPGPLNHSIIGTALKKKIFSVEPVNIRDFATNKAKSVDDKPYGGGAGMILKPDVLQKAYDFCLKGVDKKHKTIYLSPSGCKLNYDKLLEINKYENVVLICGKYEGIDSRFIAHNGIEEVSVGDYVLSGGEIASFILIDACVRLIPEVLGNKNSLVSESFQNHLIEYPQFTKPRVWQNLEVPKILLNGNHEKVSEWKLKKSIEVTKIKRPDLFELYKKKFKEKK
jgi:tRNA (guanine37-N1)-methyltransferase